MKKVLLILVIFLVLSTIVGFIPYFKLDLLVSDKIQSINSPVITNIMWFVSLIGSGPIMFMIVGITSLLLYIFKFRTEAIIGSLSTAGSALFGPLIKILVDRPRPSANLVHVSVWLSDKSYPSGHVLTFTVFFGFLIFLLYKRFRVNMANIILSIALFLLIVTVGISRIYLGVHWVSDVLGGYLLGTLWLMFTIRLYNSYNGKR